MIAKQQTTSLSLRRRLLSLFLNASWLKLQRKMMLSFMNPNTNLTAPAQSPAPDSKGMILNSICEYLEKNGFSKSVKKLRGLKDLKFVLLDLSV
ncbi:hypothetical protein Droror1_Dr00027682 [Drosera rotundifolia]